MSPVSQAPSSWAVCYQSVIEFHQKGSVLSQHPCFATAILKSLSSIPGDRALPAQVWVGCAGLF